MLRNFDVDIAKAPLPVKSDHPEPVFGAGDGSPIAIAPETDRTVKRISDGSIAVGKPCEARQAKIAESADVGEASAADGALLRCTMSASGAGRRRPNG
jgi:hypothetical protein